MDTTVVREEQVLREINEALRRGVWPGEEHRRVRMRCECGQPDCHAFVQMSAAEYEHVRADPRRFIACDGHTNPEIETVVERRPGYVVVEKTGAAARLVAGSDPRRGASGDRGAV